eukprot:TRINITY_DN1442_c0_g1_i1.p1 TRINITY_DN1442_c0_g1~~TRINITY_DN1442_c0_g1_i1.p1  ORF type:complete len:538 (-),score=116.09 TRINITY_DN1442_c0_g1_i1:192-1805(-)
MSMIQENFNEENLFLMRGPFFCEYCQVSTSSGLTHQQHLQGKLHKKIKEKLDTMHQEYDNDDDTCQHEARNYVNSNYNNQHSANCYHNTSDINNVSGAQGDKRTVNTGTSDYISTQPYNPQNYPPMHSSAPNPPANFNFSSFSAPPVHFHPKHHFQAPWSHPAPPLPKFTLSEQILLFYSYLSPTPEESAFRSKLIDNIQKIIIQIFPASNIQLLGSMCTKTHLPNSDIDLGVFNWESHQGVEGSIGQLQGLYSLSETFESHHFKSKVISSAKVPIVKISEAQTNLSVDISLDKKTALLANEFGKFCIDKWGEQLRQLIVTVKYFLMKNFLNCPFRGGLSSWSIFLMWVYTLEAFYHDEKEFAAFRQKNDPNFNEADFYKYGKYSLGSKLVRFFRFWGLEFNYIMNGISVGGINKGEQVKMYNKADRNWVDYAQPWLLSIEDPVNEENDVSRCSWNIGQVQQVFGFGYFSLKDEEEEIMEEFDDEEGGKDGRLEKILVRDPKIEALRENIKTGGSSGRASGERRGGRGRGRGRGRMW